MSFRYPGGKAPRAEPDPVRVAERIKKNGPRDLRFTMREMVATRKSRLRFRSAAHNWFKKGAQQ